MTAGDRAEHARAHRKTRDRAMILLLAGVLLLLPPMAGIFQIDQRVAGIPATYLYLFAVWGVLILGAALLAPRLAANAPRSPDGPAAKAAPAAAPEPAPAEPAVPEPGSDKRP